MHLESSASTSVPSAIERHMLGVIRRMHTGRWPALRGVKIRRSGQAIYEIVRWLRMSTELPYSVVTWSLDRAAISWRDFRTLHEARQYERALL